MRRTIFALFATLFIASAAFAQKASERYIPIGQSPGVSNKTSYIGTIDQVNEGEYWMSIASERGNFRIRMSRETRFYLDRSEMKKGNLEGSYSDCKPGRRVEVKFKDDNPEEPAEWVKVEIAR